MFADDGSVPNNPALPFVLSIACAIDLAGTADPEEGGREAVITG